MLTLLAKIPNLLSVPSSGGPPAFPATLPVPLQRKHFGRDFLLGLHAATPKIDGTRALVASDGVDVWELNRSLEERCLTGAGPRALPENASVFDAELVQLADSRKLYYLFDCLLFRGQVAANRCVSLRVALARQFCRELHDAQVVIPLLFPTFLYRPFVAAFAGGTLLLSPKPFLPAAKIPTFAATLGSDIPVDGWVFYQLGAHYSASNSSDVCLKYKPPQELTLDFRAVKVDHAPAHAKRVDGAWLARWALPALPVQREWQGVPWERYTSSTDGNWYLLLDLGPPDIPALFEKGGPRVQHVLFARTAAPPGVQYSGIVECRFARGRWEVVRPRPDKKMSNRLYTVLDTLALITDPVEVRELYAALRQYDLAPDLRCF